MSRQSKEVRHTTLVGIALMMGAWIGAVIGVLVKGGAGIALGGAIGAALGITYAIARNHYQDLHGPGDQT